MGRPETVEIYTLCDPDTRAVRYIGKARCSKSRLKTHIRDSRRRKTPVCLWVARLVRCGKAPLVEVLEVCAVDVWPERERFHIAEYRKSVDLLNLADGGDQPKCDAATAAANARKLHANMSPERKELRRLKQMMMVNLNWFKRHGDQEMVERRKARMRGMAAKYPKLLGEWAAL